MDRKRVAFKSGRREMEFEFGAFTYVERNISWGKHHVKKGDVTISSSTMIIICEKSGVHFLSTQDRHL